MAAYEELLGHFMQTMPPEVMALEGTPAFGDAFNKWTGDIMAELGVSDWSDIPVEVLGEFEYVGPGSPAAQGGPAEQELFNRVAPAAVNLIEGDAARTAEAAQLGAQTRDAYGNLGTTLDWTNIVTGPNGQPTSGLLDAQRGNVDTTVAAVTDASRAGAAATQAALDKLTADQLANLSTSLATQQQTLQQQVADLQGNATTAANARREALTQQIAQLTAAQKGVSESRIRAAENEVTGINLGLEGTRDQLAADAAREGFVGPSSMSEAALGRAAIDARQGAARTMGGARVANAIDDRSIGNYGANQGYNITDIWAGDTQRAGDMGASGRGALTAWGAETGRGLSNAGSQGTFDIAARQAGAEAAALTTGAGAKSSYFDQLFPSAVNSAQIRTGLPAAQAGALTSLIPYGTAGTRNALDILNWWSNPTGAPPTTTAVMTNPSTTGNSLSNLGTGLLGAGFQVANANDWWKPKPTTVDATKKPVVYDSWGGF